MWVAVSVWERLSSTPCWFTWKHLPDRQVSGSSRAASGRPGGSPESSVCGCVQELGGHPRSRALTFPFRRRPARAQLMCLAASTASVWRGGAVDLSKNNPRRALGAMVGGAAGRCSSDGRVTTGDPGPRRLLWPVPGGYCCTRTFPWPNNRVRPIRRRPGAGGSFGAGKRPWRRHRGFRTAIRLGKANGDHLAAAAGTGPPSRA